MIKKILTAISMTLLTMSAQADNPTSIWITTGQQQQNVSYSIGFKQYSFGLEFGYVTDVQYDGYRIDYPSYGTYSIIGERTVSYPTGTDILYFHDMGSGINAYFGIGLYNQQTAFLVQEAGYVYTQYTKMKATITGTAGVKLDLMKNVSLLGGYHSIRGTNLGLSFNF